MALFKSIFGSKKNKLPRGLHLLTIKAIQPLTKGSVQVTFDIPDSLKSTFKFTPGQYITTLVDINGEECRRSYSICSGQNEDLSIGVKEVENGKVSGWFNKTATVGDQIPVSPPEGQFIVPETAKSIIVFAAGSGITPIVSIAKAAENSEASIQLFYGNRTIDDIMFHDQLNALNNTSVSHYLSGEESDGFAKGRLDKENIGEIIKGNLELLKTDCFLLCGPEEMIVDANDTLKMFGVPESKIKFELFTTPVLMAKKEKPAQSNFKGKSSITVLLDDEKIAFELDAKGPSILETVIDEGLDAPYSCKGGVCSNCKAKVLKGSVSMDMNFSLTDKDVEEGYVLTCQAHPSSENVVISYNE